MNVGFSLRIENSKSFQSSMSTRFTIMIGETENKGNSEELECKFFYISIDRVSHGDKIIKHGMQSCRKER